jgi:phenol 2-monooxygenase (NADPH)
VELAQQLINFDRKFSKLFGGKSAIAEQAGISVEEFRNLWLKSGKWTSGTAVQYPPSLLVAASSAEKELLAANIHIGSVSFQASDDRERETDSQSLQHFESQIVVCIADAHTVHLGDQLTSDGRWRLILFAGKLTQQAQRSRCEKLCVELVSTRSPVIQYHVGQDVDIIKVLTVVLSERSAIDLTEYPDIARPACGPLEYRKYNTIFADEVSYHDGGGQAYQGYGVDPEGPGVTVSESVQSSSLLV